ncbi:hypothetical protein [uncultured Polaribacter sp.]|uniref:hypothetical protein n=1 Tax=uncultured Polaribacter sp. TaxID=174711 RepID=UPI00262D3D8C|nr:hypothetical protein [uncultured Polaribacter sp.]
MKKTTILLVMLASFVVTFSSCKVSKAYVQNISKKQDLVAPSSKNVLAFVSGDVLVNEFTKTFDKNYEDKNEFVAEFLNAFKEQANLNSLFQITTVDAGIERYEDLNKGNQDYIISFTNLEINNRVEFTSAGGFNVNGIGVQAPASVEYCVMKVKVEVYDVLTDREILDFTVTGEASVFMFNFTKTFQKAKERTMTHVVNYLKSGTTTYEKY